MKFIIRMKRYLLSLLVVLPLVSQAQDCTRLYDVMCDPLQSVFCDYVARESSFNVISSEGGEYRGTVIDDQLYGWGTVFSASGISSYGQYSNNRFMFGIVMSEQVAKVGSEEHYVVYDLVTGQIMLVHTPEGNIGLEYPFVPSKENPEPLYSFKKETYGNGDTFFGEFYKGRRHGYGVYCYTNGDLWYGEYKGGYRNGYGMLLKADNRIFYGKWIGDRKVE